MKLTRIQKIVKFFSSKEKFAAIEKETKEWKFTCSSCSTTHNFWELGGVRYKAKGEPMVRIKCPNCSETAMQKVYRKK